MFCVLRESEVIVLYGVAMRVQRCLCCVVLCVAVMRKQEMFISVFHCVRLFF